MSLIIATFAALTLCFAPAPGAAAISARRPLQGNDTLASAQGKFELGLFSPAGSSDGRFYLGVWYKNIPGQTVVWVGNRATPLSGVASAELRVSADDGNLELVGPTFASGSPVIVWSSNLSSSSSPGSNNTAEIRDNGNLVLLDGSNSSNVLWQSFDHPTDTLVPDAWLGENKLTGEYQVLTSWRNAQDPAPGMFTDTVDPNGTSEFFYMWNLSRTYWRSGVWTGRFFATMPEATRNVLFNQTYVETPAYRRVSNALYNSTTITRMVLELTGQTKQYIWVPATQNWQLFWAAPTVQCDVYALCGAFGVCDLSSQPSCRCPPGFAPASEGDWTVSDWSGGCRRSAPLWCPYNGSTTDGFVVLPNVKLPDDSLAVGAVQSKAECESACQKSCSCEAYTFSTGRCAVWHGELRNLQQLYTDSGVSRSDVYLRLSATGLRDLHNTVSKGGRLSWLVLVMTLVGVAALGASVILAWRILLTRRRRLANQKGSSLTVYSYGDLHAATNNFSERLGGGGFGSVYRGILKEQKGGKTAQVQVAVKKLESLGGRQGDKQFRTEVSTLGLIQHVNLVRLLGFCSSGDEKMLVYEYMPRGSLDGYLFDGGACPSWRDRYCIMIGVARGLAYLHHGCHECIIHCDIKPENILLDEDMSPRIADFGMAKLVGRDFSRALTTMRGTIGYLAPEWISGQPISAKADVYSFGMVLFELISGRRNSEGYSEVRHAAGTVRRGSSTFFPVWAARKVVEGEVGTVADLRLRGDVMPEELERVCKVACWCIQDQEAQRPTMVQVVQALEGTVHVHTPPVPRALQHLVMLT
ncbi:G-type lectin S-receptor-like serine/threonine-protein kinase At2g19130 [Triticum dicoccoides]|uniref:G-type lectin S-receptor-like serine/threonine-protein kinase At2g19130 n=1 Tax=Triticum dicoccoides TaxID=85692 RepID=UPI0018914B01|nr:G-type lectin S-receptor-like serine/threonine-protein kinase At2g19130 [Triticum dicoccoides]